MLIAYGITIIKNLINDRGRSKSFDSDDEVDSPDLSEFGAKYEVSQALSRLGETCQKISTLFKMGHTYDEIANVLKVPLGTVMS